NIAISDIALPPLNTEAQEITETQQSAASEAAPVESEQLTAQEWFERGYVFSNNNSFDEAIRCFSEAILLKSDFAEAYVRRGIAYGSIQKAHLAIEDFTRASELNPEDNYAYAGRGLAYHDQDDFENAITD